MKLGFFTMPVHRIDRDYTEVLQEDREAIIFADGPGTGTTSLSHTLPVLVAAQAAMPDRLLYAGKNRQDKTLGKRSTEPMAEQVMPAVNAAIGRSEVWE